MTDLLLQRPFPGATTCILVGEPPADFSADLRRFRHVLWLTDRHGIRTGAPRLNATTTHCVLVEASPAPDYAAVLARFFSRDPRHLPSLFVSRSVLERWQERYETSIAEVHAHLREQHEARTTRQQDGFAWQLHLFQNVAAYPAHRLPAAWAGALAGLPAFVCGAGPSLDVTAPRLAAVAQNGIVFAADSALRTLARHGIAADFAVSVDAAKFPDKCLPSVLPPGRVILTNVSPPAWRAMLPAASWTQLSSNQITEDWLHAQGVTATAIRGRENCGATALELARFLGCAPIWLFGLDLSVDAARPAQRHTAHADPATYRDSGFDPAQPLPTVPGNYSERVPTFALGDWRALSDRLSAWPAGLVFNVTDRGARFGNVTLVPPDQFAPPAPPVEKSAALLRLATPEPAPPAAADALALMRAAGRQAGPLIDPLRTTLAANGPAAVAPILRKFFADPANGQIFGAFTFKLLPHLMPPVEGDDACWRALIDEFAALATVAAAIGPN
jgi:hypothetical protein